jgi:predicted small metal-binding protein
VQLGPATGYIDLREPDREGVKVIYEHRCANIGAASCNRVFRAETMEELLRIVAEHARKQHAVKTPTATIMNYVARMARRV